MIKYDSSKATEGQFAPLPAGDYECIIESGAVKKGSTGNEYIDFKLKVRDDVDGQAYGGRVLWGKLHFTEASHGILMGFLKNIGTPEGKEFPTIESLKDYAVGKAISARVKITQWKGEDRNEVAYMNASKVGGGKIDNPLDDVPMNDPFANSDPTELLNSDDLPF